jgi:hypothetical protein
MKRARALVIVGLITIFVGVSEPSSAFAQTASNCTDLTNPVYMAGTTAVIPVIRLMGARLRANMGVTLLWNENADGCYATGQLITPMSGNSRTVYSYYTESSLEPGKVIPYTCNSPLNTVPDLVINDVSWTSCMVSYGSTPPTPLPAGVREFLGPVQGMVSIVPNGNTYYDVTAEELQDLYICGAKANVMSFSNSNFIWDYSAQGSGMRELWARGIGVANGSVLSTGIGLGYFSTITAESMVINYVAPSTSPDLTIGYTSTEYYDQYRGQVRGLKVRGVNQKLAYLPDFDGQSTDKINIREGRYALQGALRLIAPVDASGAPTNLQVKHIIDWFQENPVQDPALQLPFDVNEIYALRGVVPQCAMKVTKDPDTLSFRHYKPPQPCHCSFEFLATGKTGCVPCAGVDAGTCQPGQSCSHGYCEQVQ